MSGSDIVNPGIGLIIWMTIAFAVVWFLLAKFAWKPILGAIKKREESIADALKAAENARKEMQSLQSENENILKEARAERDGMLKEARELRTQMIEEAKTEAKEAAEKENARSKEAFENQMNAAITELRNEVASLSISIAEKVLKSELEDKKKQQALVQELLKDVKLN